MTLSYDINGTVVVNPIKKILIYFVDGYGVSFLQNETDQLRFQ